MGAPPVPHDEAARRETLASLQILDTPPEESFDDLVRVASELCGTPVAFVSFVDENRQWFKARVNFNATETSRKISFCGHAIVGTGPLVIPDTQSDPRFADNPLVVNDPHIRFYAGIPLQVDEGSAVGTLCVADYVPRQLTPTQLGHLQTLGRQIARELQLRRSLATSRPPPPASTVPLNPGDVVDGKWRIVRMLGKGASGAVFEARGPDDDRAAIKVLLREWCAQEPMVERFAREARILSQLQSPHVCGLLDVGNLEPARGGLPFLVLEYMEGTDLERVIAKQKRVAWQQAAVWLADACDGVADAHDHGVIHRDLKPSNVFLAMRPLGKQVVKVLDFGIAKIKADNAHLTRVGSMIGTPQYMSPEQMMAAEDVGARSDVWSLGVTLYELVSGEAPFPGRTEMEICAAILSRAPPPLHTYVHEFPDALQEIITTCLQKKPDARYQSMRDVQRALVGIVERG